MLKTAYACQWTLSQGRHRTYIYIFNDNRQARNIACIKIGAGRDLLSNHCIIRTYEL